MIPIWIWDPKSRTYLTLPAPVQQFKSGNWGWTREQVDSDHRIIGFYNRYRHLVNFVGEDTGSCTHSWKWGELRLELKLKKPTKHKWHSKETSKITKVQR